MLAYRHSFHAGNHADVLKHIVQIAVLNYFNEKGKPYWVIDTHAGAGLYDLQGEAAQRTGEAEVGVRRLMADEGAPEAFATLKAAVRRANRARGLRYYPGSPLLIAETLRVQDSYLACELHPEDYADLTSVLPQQAGARALLADGWREARSAVPPAPASSRKK